ncbi:MAG: PAS domain S-box protein, partial [Gemmatimonadales bacterium]
MNARRRAFSGLSIEWQLPVMVGAMVLGVTAALCWAAYVQVSRSVELAARERLSGVAAQMVNSAQASIEQLSHGAARLGAQPALQAWVRAIDDGVHSTDTAAIRLLLPRDTAILALEIWDVHRHRIYSTGQAARQVLALDSVESLDQQPVPDSGRVGRLRAIGDTVAFAAVAPVSRGGSAIGYVVLWRRATTRTRTNRQMEGLIGGSGGALLIGSSPGAWTDQATVVPPPPVTVRRPMTARYLRAGGRERLAALAPVPGSPWLIAVELPRDVVQAPARRFVANFALIAVAVLALGLLCSWVFSRRITGPLTRLTETADAISGGNQAVRASIDRRDEWGRLATAFNQMLDRVDAEAAARRDSEEQWRSLFEHSPHPMWLIDVDSLAILRVNEASVRHYGYSREEFAGMTIRDLRPPEDRSALDALIQAADPDAESFRVVRHRRKDGTIIRVEARGRPLALPGHRARLVSATDITERALLEEQLRQSQKMEAVGRLAGGVAHDFNNLLTVIGGYSEQLMGSRLNPEDHASVAEIAAAASRAAALTRQLLMFSRKQIVQHQVLDLNDVVLGVDPMLRRLLCENIELVTHLSPAAALVIADVSQLEQVIVNLAVNAADAMPTGGMLAIETAVVELDESYTSTHTEVTPGC